MTLDQLRGQFNGEGDKAFPIVASICWNSLSIDFVQQPGLFLEQPLKTLTCTDWPLTDVFVSKNGNLLIYLINDL